VVERRGLGAYEVAQSSLPTLAAPMLANISQWFGAGATRMDTGAQLSQISLEYPETELARATDNFTKLNQLGAGNYGAVYRGCFRDGSEVAIKMLEVTEDSQIDSGFADEVRTLSKFRHPNLVTLMGWGKGHGRRYLVYELLAGGDICHRLRACHSSGGEQFLWNERLRVALDAASGLSHMHNSMPKAFHRDIKSANVLLDRNGTAKMADFGLSMVAPKKGAMELTCEHISGTPGYACPHYIKTGRITEYTEVFAYGMLLLELMMNAAPACIGDGGGIIYPIFQTIRPGSAGARERALGALDPAAQWPPPLAGELVDLALACTAMEAKRPDFVGILKCLRPLVERYAPSGHNSHNRSHSGQLTPSMPPTNPQMGYGAGRGTPPTNPQMGLSAGRGTIPPTKPLRGGAASYPQQRTSSSGGQPMAGGTAPRASSRQEAPTEIVAGPEVDSLGLGLMANDVPPARVIVKTVPSGGWAARNGVQVGAEIVALNGLSLVGLTPDQFRQVLQRRPLLIAFLPPRGAPAKPANETAEANAGSKSPRGGFGGFFDAVKGLWRGGGGEGEAAVALASAPNAQAAAELVEVVLECTYAIGVDVPTIPLKHKCLALILPGPWTFGRQQQPQLFARLVPDESLRSCISRSHLELTWEAPNLCLKKLSPNVLLINGAPATYAAVTIGPGTHLGFCGRDNKTPFIIFNVLFRDSATVAAAGPTPLPTHPDVPCTHAPSSNRQLDLEQRLREQQQQLQQQQEALQQVKQQLDQQQEPDQSSVTAPVPSSSYYLVCTLARGGCAPAEQPMEVKVIPVPEGKRMTVGRTSQPGFFEGLLGPNSNFLAFISRSHFDLSPLSGRDGVFELTNLSTNPIVLQQQRLQKGQSGAVGPDSSIDFISKASPTDPSPMIYFRFVLERTQAFNSAGHQALGAEEIVRALATTAAPQVAGVGALQPCQGTGFWLEIEGTAVRPECPPAQRRIAGTRDGVIVGRSYQPQLFMQTLREEVLQFISREHFRVDRGEDGNCRLLPLTNNPMWRVRAGHQAEARRGQPPLLLADGDCLQVFTGARDCTADGPGSVGTLYWRFLLPGDASLGETSPVQHPLDDRRSSPSPCNLQDRRSIDFHNGPPEYAGSRGSSIGHPGTALGLNNGVNNKPAGTVMGLHGRCSMDESEVGTVPLLPDPYANERADSFASNPRAGALTLQHPGGTLRVPVALPLESEENCAARAQERFSVDSKSSRDADDLFRSSGYRRTLR